MLSAKLLVDISDQRDKMRDGAITEEEYEKRKDALKKQFRIDEAAQWRQQTQDINEFVKKCKPCK